MTNIFAKLDSDNGTIIKNIGAWWEGFSSPGWVKYDSSAEELNIQAGDFYINGSFVVNPDKVVKEEIAPTTPILTKLEFRKRFTVEEKTTIYNTAETNVLVKIWLDDLQAAEYVNVEDQETVESINNLSQLGLIESSRVSEILALKTL